MTGEDEDMDKPRQSVAVLLCDQLQRHVMSTYGGPVPTPTFDRLADEGVAFDRFYCATPLCAPTRPSMMNGRWPHAHGALCNTGKGYCELEEGSELLINRLLDAGYHIAYDGIWHIRQAEADDRTDEYDHFRRGGFPYQEHGEHLVEMGLAADDQREQVTTLTDEGEQQANISVPVPATWTRPLTAHPDMQRARRIAQFILDAPEDEPIGVWCSLAGPHPPLLVPEPYMSMFDPDEIEPPPGFDIDLSGEARGVREAPGRLGTLDWGWERWAPAIAAYYGYVAFVDHCQGIVMDALEKTGRLDNTIVIASTDHGEMLGSHGIYQKMVMYERAINIPFVMRIPQPGIEPGRREQLACQTDMAPTVLDLLGMEPLAKAQGQSMKPILRDPDATWPDATFSEYNGWTTGGHRMRAVIQERYKYVYHHEEQRDQLFDLERDPNELENLIDEPQHLELIDEMRSKLVGWMRDTDDVIQPEWAGPE